VLRNLKREGFSVAAIADVQKEKCGGYPDDVKVVDTNREVAEMSDVVVSGEK